MFIVLSQNGTFTYMLGTLGFVTDWYCTGLLSDIGNVVTIFQADCGLV